MNYKKWYALSHRNVHQITLTTHLSFYPLSGLLYLHTSQCKLNTNNNSLAVAKFISCAILILFCHTALSHDLSERQNVPYNFYANP